MRAAIDADLQAREWRWGISGDYRWHWDALRFVAPDQLVYTHGSDSAVGGGALPDEPVVGEAGTYRVTESGAVEQILSNSTRRSTYLRPGPSDRLWAWGFVRTPSAPTHYWREEMVRTAADHRELVVELVLGAAVTSLAPGGPCTAHLRAEGSVTTDEAHAERAGIDLELTCVVERRRALLLLRFSGLELPTRAIDAHTDWSNWLAINGHAPWTSTAMHDLMGAAFQSVLVWDPGSPDVLRGLRDEDLGG
jgi:hypothetical protein